MIEITVRWNEHHEYWVLNVGDGHSQYFDSWRETHSCYVFERCGHEIGHVAKENLVEPDAFGHALETAHENASYGGVTEGVPFDYEP